MAKIPGIDQVSIHSIHLTVKFDYESFDNGYIFPHVEGVLRSYV